MAICYCICSEHDITYLFFDFILLELTRECWRRFGVGYSYTYPEIRNGEMYEVAFIFLLSYHDNYFTFSRHFKFVEKPSASPTYYSRILKDIFVI